MSLNSSEKLTIHRIPGCYLSLYEHPAVPTEGTRLLLAYNEANAAHPGQHSKSRIDVRADGQLFPPSQSGPETRRESDLLLV